MVAPGWELIPHRGTKRFQEGHVAVSSRAAWAWEADTDIFALKDGQ